MSFVVVALRWSGVSHVWGNNMKIDVHKYNGKRWRHIKIKDMILHSAFEMHFRLPPFLARDG